MYYSFRKLYHRVIDTVFGLWQGRFSKGIQFNLGGIITGWNSQAMYMLLSLFVFTSVGTYHWPFPMFELAFKRHMKRFEWHVTLLGLVLGRCWVQVLNEDGSIAGPDVPKYYWFFKCINHQGQGFNEIINSVNTKKGDN